MAQQNGPLIAGLWWHPALPCTQRIVEQGHFQGMFEGAVHDTRESGLGELCLMRALTTQEPHGTVQTIMS